MWGQYTFGGWRLAAGGWRLAAGGWRLAGEVDADRGRVSAAALDDPRRRRARGRARAVAAHRCGAHGVPRAISADVPAAAGARRAWCGVDRDRHRVPSSRTDRRIARAGARHVWARGGAVQDAEDALKPWRGRVSVVAHVRYGLLTIGAPEIAVALSGDRLVLPIDTKTTSVFAGDTIVGGDVDASFDSAAVGQKTWIVVVRSNGGEIASAPFDFAAVD